MTPSQSKSYEDLVELAESKWPGLSPVSVEYFVRGYRYALAENERNPAPHILELVAALKFYASHRNWTWESEKVYDNTPLTNIVSDKETLDYTEKDGDVFTRDFGGKRAREALKNYEEKVKDDQVK